MRKSWYTFIVFFLCFSLNFQVYSANQANKHRLYALYVGTFVKYIEWEGFGEEFTIGFVGNSDLIDILVQDLEKKNKTVDSKPIRIVRLTSDEQMANCQIIFVPENRSNDLSGVLETTEGNNVLVLTESDLVNEGAAISFSGSPPRYKINLDACNRARLKVKQQLIALSVN